MASHVTMKRLLGFKDFFPNETPRVTEYYATKLGKDLIFKTSCYFLDYFRFRGNPPVEQLLADWFTFNSFSYESSPTYYVIEREYRRIKNFHKNEPHSLLSVESLLDMYLWCLASEGLPESIEAHDSSICLPLLELVLLFNDGILAKYERVTQSIKPFGEDRKLQRLILAGSFSHSDLENIDYAQLFYTQFYKKGRLLEFLALTERYQPLLMRVLNEFGCSTKEEFLRAVGAAVALPFVKNEPSWRVLNVKEDENKKKNIQILENLAVEDLKPEDSEQNDYLALRSKPFHRISETQYRVIFGLFLIKKLYNGLIFKLASYDRNFLGNIRNDFSEGVLVYETLEYVLGEAGAVKITGNEFKSKDLGREPDFYYRNKNKMALFESKDFFMPGTIKLSYDFSAIEGELMKNGRLKKAVVQLVTNILRALRKELPIDNHYDQMEMEIYPVIIVHDSLYSAPGLNFWVYYWFLDELEKVKADDINKELDFSGVKPVTLVEIDSLILYQDHFKEGRLSLIGLLEGYHQHVRYDLAGKVAGKDVEAHALQSASSFAEFLRDMAHQKGLPIWFSRIDDLLNRLGIE